MSSYSAGIAGPMWPQDQNHHGWYQQDFTQTAQAANLWGPEQPKQWGHDQHKLWESDKWGSDKNWVDSWGEKQWGDKQWNDKQWGRTYMEVPATFGRQDDYRDYHNNFQVLDSRLKHQASQLGHLREEPDDVLVVNSMSSGAYSSLCADAAKADLIAFDAEWAPDHTYGSDNPISVLQLAFPLSRRVYVLQLNRIGGKLPSEVQMMLVNPEVRKVGFAVDDNDRQKMTRSGIALTNGSVTDVQELCAVALGVTGNAKSLSLKNAAFGLLGITLEKDKRLSCSDWASNDLTPQQVRYAALDAWVPLRLCYMLSS